MRNVMPPNSHLLFREKLKDMARMHLFRKLQVDETKDLIAYECKKPYQISKFSDCDGIAEKLFINKSTLQRWHKEGKVIYLTDSEYEKIKQFVIKKNDAHPQYIRKGRYVSHEWSPGFFGLGTKYDEKKAINLWSIEEKVRFMNDMMKRVNSADESIKMDDLCIPDKMPVLRMFQLQSLFDICHFKMKAVLHSLPEADPQITKVLRKILKVKKSELKNGLEIEITDEQWDQLKKKSLAKYITPMMSNVLVSYVMGAGKTLMQAVMCEAAEAAGVKFRCMTKEELVFQGNSDFESYGVEGSFHSTDQLWRDLDKIDRAIGAEVILIQEGEVFLNNDEDRDLVAAFERYSWVCDEGDGSIKVSPESMYAIDETGESLTSKPGLLLLFNKYLGDTCVIALTGTPDESVSLLRSFQRISLNQQQKKDEIGGGGIEHLVMDMQSLAQKKFNVRSWDGLKRSILMPLLVASTNDYRCSGIGVGLIDSQYRNSVREKMPHDEREQNKKICEFISNVEKGLGDLPTDEKLRGALNIACQRVGINNEIDQINEQKEELRDELIKILVMPTLHHSSLPFFDRSLIHATTEEAAINVMISQGNVCNPWEEYMPEQQAFQDGNVIDREGVFPQLEDVDKTAMETYREGRYKDQLNVCASETGLTVDIIKEALSEKSLTHEQCSDATMRLGFERQYLRYLLSICAQEGDVVLSASDIDERSGEMMELNPVLKEEMKGKINTQDVAFHVQEFISWLKEDGVITEKASKYLSVGMACGSVWNMLIDYSKSLRSLLEKGENIPIPSFSVKELKTKLPSTFYYFPDAENWKYNKGINHGHRDAPMSGIIVNHLRKSALPEGFDQEVFASRDRTGLEAIPNIIPQCYFRRKEDQFDESSLDRDDVDSLFKAGLLGTLVSGVHGTGFNDPNLRNQVVIHNPKKSPAYTIQQMGRLRDMGLKKSYMGIIMVDPQKNVIDWERYWKDSDSAIRLSDRQYTERILPKILAEEFLLGLTKEVMSQLDEQGAIKDQQYLNNYIMLKAQEVLVRCEQETRAFIGVGQERGESLPFETYRKFHNELDRMWRYAIDKDKGGRLSFIQHQHLHSLWRFILKTITSIYLKLRDDKADLFINLEEIGKLDKPYMLKLFEHLDKRFIQKFGGFYDLGEFDLFYSSILREKLNGCDKEKAKAHFQQIRVLPDQSLLFNKFINILEDIDDDSIRAIIETKVAIPQVVENILESFNKVKKFIINPEEDIGITNEEIQLFIQIMDNYRDNVKAIIGLHPGLEWNVEKNDIGGYYGGNGDGSATIAALNYACGFDKASEARRDIAPEAVNVLRAQREELYAKIGTQKVVDERKEEGARSHQPPSSLK